MMLIENVRHLPSGPPLFLPSLPYQSPHTNSHSQTSQPSAAPRAKTPPPLRDLASTTTTARTGLHARLLASLGFRTTRASRRLLWRLAACMIGTVMRRAIIPSALLSLSARLMSAMGRGDNEGCCLKASNYTLDPSLSSCHCRHFPGLISPLRT
jgi:hypothetical protein